MKKLKIIILLASCVLCLAAFFGLLIWTNIQTGSLKDQQLAERWSSDGGFAQNSVYLTLGSGIALDDIIPLRRSINSALMAESVDAVYDDRGWLDTYSANKNVTATHGVASCSAVATGIGGDFFLFHPMQLIAGAYISESDLMHDLAVIDDLAAWFLFGSNDCIGMDFDIGDQTYIVAGVVAREETSAMELAYGDTARIYVQFDLLGADEISIYETLIPNPIPEFAQKIMLKALKKSETSYSAVENTDRFTIPKIYELIKDSPKNAMRTVPIAYPFWENAARVVENRLTRAYAAMLILLLYPAVVLIVFIVMLWKRRTWRAFKIVRGIGDKIYAVQAQAATSKREREKNKAKAEKPASQQEKAAALERADEQIKLDMAETADEIIEEINKTQTPMAQDDNDRNGHGGLK